MYFYKIVVDSDIFYVSRKTIENTAFEAVLNKQKYERISYDRDTLTFYVDADIDSFKNIITKMRGYNINMLTKDSDTVKKYNKDYKYFVQDIKLNIKLESSPVVIKLDIDNSDVDTENIIQEEDKINTSMMKLVPELDDNNISNIVGGSYYYSPDDRADLDISSPSDYSISGDSSINIKIVDYYETQPVISSDSDSDSNTSDFINNMLNNNIEHKCSPNKYISPDQDNYDSDSSSSSNSFTVTQLNPMHDIFKSYIQDQELD